MTDTVTIEGQRIRAIAAYAPDSGRRPAFPASICVLPDGRWYGAVAWEDVPTADGRVLTNLHVRLPDGTEPDSVPLLLLGDGGERVESSTVVGRVTLLEISAPDELGGPRVVVGAGTCDSLEPGVYAVGVEVAER